MFLARAAELPLRIAQVYELSLLGFRPCACSFALSLVSCRSRPWIDGQSICSHV